MSAISEAGLTKVALREKAEKVRATLNPHPAGQKEENVPVLDGCEVPGMQHKYRETILFFPTEVKINWLFCVYTFLTLCRVNSVIHSVLTVFVGLNSPRSDHSNNFSPKRRSACKTTLVGIPVSKTYFSQAAIP